MPCILELAHLSAIKSGTAKVSVAKASAKICAIQHGALLGKKQGTCRIVVKEPGAKGKQHKVSLAVS